VVLRKRARVGSMPPEAVDLDAYEVAAVSAGFSYRVRFVLLSVVAWTVAIIDFDASGDAPRRPYRVVLREKSTGAVLYEEGVFHGEEALDALEGFATEIRKAGVKDFVYKKQHGWRID